ncbi:MAG: proline--tRNA ligase anticodon binding domain-containing protein, partial [Chitinophagaceae bacterium]
AHSDDDGLVLPPKIAPLQVAIIPIYKGIEQKDSIDEMALRIKGELQKAGVRVIYDKDDSTRPGWKFAEYELKGVPVRIVMGTRDLEQNQVEVSRRDTHEKVYLSLNDLSKNIQTLLEDIQKKIFEKARIYRDEHITRVDDFKTFEKVLDEQGGFVSAHWDGTAEAENKIKELTKATIRCIPLNNPQEDGKCILTGKPSKERVLFARAY